MTNKIAIYHNDRLDTSSTYLVELEYCDRFAMIYPLTTEPTIPAWLMVSFCLFFLGIVGIVYSYRNFLVTMMSIEAMYLGAVTGFVFYGIAYGDITAAVYGLLVLIFAACESAVGLGLLVSIHRFGQSIGFNSLTVLGG